MTSGARDAGPGSPDERPATRPAARYVALVAVQVGLVGILAGTTATFVDAHLLTFSHARFAPDFSGPAATLVVHLGPLSLLAIPLALCGGVALASSEEGPGAAAGAAVGVLLVVAVLVGYLAAPLGVAAAGDPTEQRRVRPPAVAIDYDYDPTGDGRGVLTIEHAGGEPIPARALAIVGEGFAEVPGANQTAPGRWRGTTTTDDATPLVTADDRVAVGVTDDCSIRLVYRVGDGQRTIDRYDCPG